jgi:hypothetical protein
MILGIFILPVFIVIPLNNYIKTQIQSNGETASISTMSQRYKKNDNQQIFQSIKPLESLKRVCQNRMAHPLRVHSIKNGHNAAPRAPHPSQGRGWGRGGTTR